MLSSANPNSQGRIIDFGFETCVWGFGYELAVDVGAGAVVWRILQMFVRIGSGEGEWGRPRFEL